MPEMPEVETIGRKLIESGLIGKKIESINLYLPSLISPSDVNSFKQELTGAIIQSCTRRGKYLIFSLDKKIDFVVHFRMTGKFLIVKEDDERGPHEHAAFYFENWDQSLRYSDVRKFGKIAITKNAQELLEHLGPEPLECTFEQFSEIMKNESGSLKTTLLDQEVIAGLGNIYCDEALFLAKLYPKKVASSLTSKESKNLLSAIKNVLEKGIRNGGSSLGHGAGNFLNPSHERGANQSSFAVYGQKGSPCTVCKTPIVRIVVAQRSTHFCPNCQKQT